MSLLNVVYKIGSAAIANRIKTMLHETDQTGFMSGKYTADNLRPIYDMTAYLKENNLPGLLLNIYSEKAFDAVDWKFMFKGLKAFGFKKYRCSWIETFYTNIKSTVIVSGLPSKWFPICRGL